MARPYRPNPYQGPRKRSGDESEEQRAKRLWRGVHPKQETAAERKARKHADAVERCHRDHSIVGEGRCRGCGLDGVGEAPKRESKAAA